MAEPANLKLGVATKALWSFYAIGYKHPALLTKISKSLAANHTFLQMEDVVACCKAMAYFD